LLCQVSIATLCYQRYTANHHFAVFGVFLSSAMAFAGPAHQRT
jgi:hypothetical protein